MWLYYEGGCAHSSLTYYDCGELVVFLNKLLKLGICLWLTNHCRLTDVYLQCTKLYPPTAPMSAHIEINKKNLRRVNDLQDLNLSVWLFRGRI